MADQPQLIRTLFDGPLDVIGDVHGEVDPLRTLIAQLGYDAEGFHREGRRLVFVGDLCDRGPDSVAVIDLVRGLVARGRAQCVLGNHELNLLRGELKQGNAWFIDPTHEEQQAGGDFAHSRVVPKDRRLECLAFLASLPLALERDDLRVVHAAWVAEAVAQLRNDRGSIIEVYDSYEQRLATDPALRRLEEQATAEAAEWKSELVQGEVTVPLLEALGRSDELYQMGNPVRVLTSGVERLARKPFWSSGKWRMCDRVKWWEEYADVTPVIVGHYWRRWRPVMGSTHVAHKPDLFSEVRPTDWMGKERNVFCVDYSVGGRYQERKSGTANPATHLMAMRWPERQLWGEEGRMRD